MQSCMTVLFRADGNVNIGAGHIMRCLSLAQALQDQGGEAVFLCSDLAAAYAKRLKEERCTVCALKDVPYGEADAHETVKTAKEQNAAWIILDGYEFSLAFQKIIRAAGLHLLVIDDHRYHEKHTCDILLNQNPQCGKKYEGIDARTPLLGTRFTMLRREYRERQRDTHDVSKSTKRILITLGGSDPQNMTPMVIRALNTMSVPWSGTVVIGGASAHEADVKKAVKDSGADVKIQKDVKDMPSLIAEHDFAISAAGSTCYELAFMGVPAATIVVADNHNQDGVAEGLDEAGATVHLGFYRDLSEATIGAAIEKILHDQNRLKEMSARGRALIDGEGVQRVLMHMTGNRLRLRNANEADCELIFRWANDPVTRAASFSTAQIPWEEHKTWFMKKLSEPKTMLLIACDKDDRSIGYFRTEHKGKEYVLSVAVDAAHRGKGFSKELIACGSQRFFARNPKELLHAYVKPDNAVSTKLFRGMGTEQTPGSDGTLHFTIERDIIAP